MLIIILSLIFELAFAQNYESRTLIRWVPGPKDFEGTCYEIDRETMGQKYVSKIQRDQCRPENIDYVWIKNTEGIGGKCYLVDAETKGKGYSSFTSVEKCEPKNAIYTLKTLPNGNLRCFKVDRETGGVNYAVNSMLDKCRPDQGNLIHKWFLKNEVEGDCFLVDKDSEGGSFREKVSISECRPERTRFSFVAGNCYEIDAFKGRENFIIKSKVENCEEGEVQFVFVKFTNGEIGGECFRVSEGGTKVSVNSSNCRPEQVIQSFIKTGERSGICVETDLTGENFIQKTQIANCRPLKTKHVWFQGNVSSGCYEVDEETGGAKYINSVSSKECSETLGVPTFRPNLKDIVGGDCIQVNRVGHRSEESKIRIERCRPEKTIIRWVAKGQYSGGCYEIDSEGNARVYSAILEDKKCLPEKVDYVFVKLDEKKLSECYRVDSKTKGFLYSKKVSNNYCRDALGL